MITPNSEPPASDEVHRARDRQVVAQQVQQPDAAHQRERSAAMIRSASPNALNAVQQHER